MNLSTIKLVTETNLFVDAPVPAFPDAATPANVGRTRGDRDTMARRKSELLTSVELDYMKALWTIGEGSVRDVIAALDAGSGRAYTSVATILRILEDKGYLMSEKRDRSLLYRPLLAREDYEARSLRSLSKSLFDGTPSALVARLVDDESLDDSEIAAIMSVIEQRMGRGDE